MAAPFDEYATDYTAALERGLLVSGENQHYFAERRVDILARSLEVLGHRAGPILDFGCGDGATTCLLQERLGAEAVGADIAPALVDRAREIRAGSGARFLHTSALQTDGRFALVYCNGVFHHIAPQERAAAMARLRDGLRPGGILALWDNNPWSPAARYVMSRIPFDRDAVMLWPHAGRRLMRANGLRPLRTEYHFVFPRALRALRVAEPLLAVLPLGAQFQILARRD